MIFKYSIFIIILDLVSSQTLDAPFILKSNETEDDYAVIQFHSNQLTLIPEGEIVNISWSTSLEEVSNIELSVEHEDVSRILEGTTFHKVTDGDNITAKGSFRLEAVMLGYNTINITLYDRDEKVIAVESVETTVMIYYQKLNEIFTNSIAVLLALTYINMGATIDLNLMKEIIKRPIGPILGIVCQYIGMPLIALGLSFVVFKDDPIFRLGMFMAGCVPGGGASNMWTHLLGGSLDLSVLMTFSSTFAAFILIPAWILGVGPIVLQGASFTVPFLNIAIIIVSLIVPLGIGLIIQKKSPKLTKLLSMTLTPFSLFNVVYIFSFGIYAYRYIFNFAQPKVILTSISLPFLGYTLGLVSSKLLGQSLENIIAISIETGIQNVSIAIFMLNFTLPQPAGALSIVIPCGTVLTTPIPLLLLFLVRRAYLKLSKKGGKMKVTDPGKNKVSDDKIKTVSTIELPETKMESGGIDNPAAELSDIPI